MLSLGEMQTIDETAHPADTTLGIITLGPRFSTEDTIRLYNHDGSLWHLFSYKYNDSDGKYDFYNPDFQPLGFHPDYYVLALSVTSINNKTYEVIVNESTGLRKYIKLKDNKLKFLTYQQYIFQQGFFLFDTAGNPVRDSINGQPIVISDAKERVARPKKFQGDWLMINFENRSSKASTIGWIRWRKAQTLLIYFVVD